MGAGQSIPTRLTHQALFDLTKDTRNMMNILLEYTMKELSVRDFLLLSNPTECKKYVLFMANNLYQHFYELQIVPTKDKSGVLVFRPAAELTSPTDEAAKQERQGLCLILAFYYTRIFQIYGALALTLLDDMNVAADTGMLRVALRDQRRRLLAPGQQSYFASAGAYESVLSLGNFAFLTGYMKRSGDEFLTNYKGDGSKKATIYFKRVPTRDDKEVQQGIFRINYGGKTLATLDVYAVKKAKDREAVRVEFQLTLYDKKRDSVSKSASIPDDILSANVIDITPFGEGRSQRYYVSPSNQTVPDFMDTFFEKLVPFIKSKMEDSEAYVETSAMEGLRLDRTIQNLTKTKPLGHCIARALQLLQADPFDDKKKMSSICEAKFLHVTRTTEKGVKTEVTRSGLPSPGDPLSESPGMTSLSQLFYDIVEQGSPRLGVGQSSMKEYLQFMRNLAVLYGDNKDPKDPGQSRSAESFVELGLKGIKNKRDRDLCVGTSGKIPVGESTASLVSRYVNKLFQLQLEHATKCGAIFQKLFSIRRDRSTNRLQIALNDNIIKKGFPEIQRINAEARTLLVQYYTNCEKTYLYGMNEVLASKHAATKQAHTPPPGMGPALPKAAPALPKAATLSTKKTRALPAPSAPSEQAIFS